MNDTSEGLDPFSIRRRAEALASADTRTLKRAPYDEPQTALTATSYQLRYELPATGGNGAMSGSTHRLLASTDVSVSRL